MSREGRYTELREKTQQLLEGSLKHARTAALAAALVPLASVAVSRAVVQGQLLCSSGSCTAVQSPCDFVTSGGFVIGTLAGQNENFGAHGGCKNGGFWGHVNFVDHTGYHLDSITITGYLAPFGLASPVRDICGTATTNGSGGQPVLFRVRLVDNGEPGVADQFGIVTSDGHSVSTRLLNNGLGGGGNVQLHRPNASTTAPVAPVTEASMCGTLQIT